MPESINISASRGAAILGLANYETPVEAWLKLMEQRKPGFCEQNGYVTPVREENNAMQFGHAFEDAIVKLYSQTTDRVVQHRELYVEKSGSEYYITTHIDGISVDNTIGLEADKLYEAKTANIRAWRESWGEPATDQIPADYMIQVQHQMICTGIDHADVCVLILPESQDWMAENGKPIEELDTIQIAQALTDLGFFKIYHVQKNEQLQARMIEAYRDFWETNVLGEKPPEPQTYDDIRKICPAPSGTILAPVQHHIVNIETNEIVCSYQTLEEAEFSMKTYKNFELEYEIRTKSVLEELCSEYNQTNEALKAANKRKDDLKKMITNGMRKLSAEAHEDPESIDKWILMNQRGKKIATFTGQKFMVGRGA